MTDPTPQRDQSPDRNPPVMGDHPDLEDDANIRPLPDEQTSNLARLLVPGLIVLVVVLVVIGYFVFFD